MNDRGVIDAFLGGHRIALVGVSSHANDFSRIVLRDLVAHGYDVVPVRPGAVEIEGRAAYGRVQDVPGTLDGALVMTPPSATDAVVRDCADAGVARVWLHRGVGRGAVSDDAVAFCRAHEIDVVAGECPLMFLDDAWVHRAHAAIRYAEGRLPVTAPPARTRVPWFSLAAHAVVAWLLCVAALGLARPLGTTAVELAPLIATPIVFAVIARNHAQLHAGIAPLATATVLVIAFAALSVLAVGPSLLGSALGLWIPIALGFAAALVISARPPDL